MSVTLQISEGALRHNLQTLKAKVAPAELMFIVKANGYGHGNLTVSKIAVSEGITDLGCLEIENALEVRSVIKDPRVNVLAWQFDQFDSLDKVASNNIQLGIGNFAQLEQLAEHQGGAIRVHLKIDTGLNRNGMRERDWKKFVNRAFELEQKGVIEVVAVWSHIAETSDAHDDVAKAKFELALGFAEAKFGRKLLAHLAASSASFRRSEFRFDKIRNGGHVYGIPSFDGTSSKQMGVIPVMTAVSSVEEVEKLESGEFQVTVAAGYTHGIPSLVADRVEIAINGMRYKVKQVGAESLIAVGEASAHIGASVYLFGDETHGEQTVREWGDAVGTLGDEICCRMSPSLERRLVK